MGHSTENINDSFPVNLVPRREYGNELFVDILQVVISKVKSSCSWCNKHLDLLKQQVMGKVYVVGSFVANMDVSKILKMEETINIRIKMPMVYIKDVY